MQGVAFAAMLLFQSTHPVRGATLLPAIKKAILEISIHAPREGCDEDRAKAEAAQAISIHAPREGCDCGYAPTLKLNLLFQSTHPVRGAT